MTALILTDPTHENADYTSDTATYLMMANMRVRFVTLSELKSTHLDNVTMLVVACDMQTFSDEIALAIAVKTKQGMQTLSVLDVPQLLREKLAG